MKSTTLLTLVLLSGSIPVFAADPQLLNLAMPNAQMFAGVNVEQAKTSPFGQFLLANMPVNDDVEKFIDATGFDPRTGFREILVATSGTPVPTAPGTKPTMSGLFMAKGTFNISKIVTAATSDAKVQLSTYNGVQLLTIGEKDSGPAFGLIDDSTVVVGGLADVKAAIDRRSQNNAIAANIMARINELSTTEDVWSVSTANFGNLPFLGQDGSSGSALLKGIQQASGGIKFGSQVQLVAQAIAQSSQDATSLSDVIKMLGTMVQLNTSTSGVPQELVNLLKSLVVSTDGSAVNVSLSIPESQLESVIQTVHGHSANAHI